MVPQHGPTDITSSRFAVLNEGRIEYAERHVHTPPRGEFDALAAVLAQQPLAWVRRGRERGA